MTKVFKKNNKNVHLVLERTNKHISFFSIMMFLLIMPSAYGMPGDDEQKNISSSYPNIPEKNRKRKNLSMEIKETRIEQTQSIKDQEGKIIKTINIITKKTKTTQFINNSNTDYLKNTNEDKAQNSSLQPSNDKKSFEALPHHLHKVPEKQKNIILPKEPEDNQENSIKIQDNTVTTIQLHHLHSLLNKSYQIPKGALKPLFLKIFRGTDFGTPQNKKKAYSLSNHTHSIDVMATSFSVKQKEDNNIKTYDYIDINLNTNLKHDSNLGTCGFLPTGYYILAYPVRIDFSQKSYINIEKDDCLVEGWWSNPRRTNNGKTTYLKDTGYQINGTVGFPKFISLGAIYSSTNTLSRELPDTTIVPDHSYNAAKWKIKHENLSVKSPFGTNHEGSNPQNLRWVWRVEKSQAEEKLYTITKNTKRIYFKIDLFTQFARVADKVEDYSTQWLPIVENKEEQFFWVDAPLSPTEIGSIRIIESKSEEKTENSNIK